MSVRGRGDARLTPPRACEFWDRWPAIGRQLDAQLRAQGVSPHDRQDIVQDVALAALDAWVAGRIATSLEGWCAVVARNAAKRRGSRRGRDTGLEAADTLRARGASVEEAVQSRLEVEALGRAWRRLSQSDQALLVAARPPSADPRSRNRHYVALHRARTRARALMDGAMVGWVGWLLPRRRAGGGGLAQGLTSLAVASAAAVGLSVMIESGVAGYPEDRVGFPPTAASAAPPRPAAPVRAAADPSGSGGDARPTARQGLVLPIEPRHEVDVADDRRFVLGIENGDPEGEPLLCATAPPVLPSYCFDPASPPDR